jgi:hypothetical protein
MRDLRAALRTVTTFPSDTLDIEYGTLPAADGAFKPSTD